ncbi:MAG TPA: IS91 family transposase [Tichowtungia sp.]|nr:IS91 family transposase [Tichowtungia sp.]
MARPLYEVADVLRAHGDTFLKAQPQPPHVCSALNLIRICRTAALDGHLDRCPSCGFERPSYNSCRNRHCPKCQVTAKQEWLEARRAELLDVPYFHCVFTLPHELNPLILQNKEAALGLLFKSVNETLKGFAAEPKWKLEGQPGFIAVLHTWNQEIKDHFHLHVIIPAGVLRGSEFIRSKQARFLFPVRALSRVFAAKYRDGLLRLFEAGVLGFHGQLEELAEEPTFRRLINSTKKKPWTVYAKRPFGGPAQVFDYLGRYTHRVAINNHRIQHVGDGNVVFTAKNRKKNKTTRVTLDAFEFIRRFTLHILPPGMMKIRAYGFLANTNKKEALELIRKSLGMQPPPETEEDDPKETGAEKILRLTGLDITRCPKCQTTLVSASLPLEWIRTEIEQRAQAPP